MEKQKKIEAQRELDIIFAKALNEKVFPGAAVGYSYPGKSNIIVENYMYYGKTDIVTDASLVTRETFFDLASLTKPFVTVLSLLRLIEEKTLRFEANLDEMLSGYPVPEDKKDIKLYQLMSHSSGLPAHRPYYTSLLQIHPEDRKDALVSMILEENLEGKGSIFRYSDLGFILLGVIIEMKTGMELHDYFRRSFLKPLALEDYFLYPAREDGTGKEYAATETCPWTDTLLYGTVHDDNCRAMGGVAGHAGLFGTAEGALKLSAYICSLYQGTALQPVISKELMREAACRKKGTNWSCGFDTPSTLSSSSGTFFGEKSIGHLGFTGTSFWCDPEQGISIVLLTNRVCPTRKDERIKRYRPKIYNAIMEKILAH
jgi:serine-type D-Ala-D-Ala carboxypeptidase